MYVRSKSTPFRNNSTTRYVQNTLDHALDPVFDVESDGELGSDSKPRRNGFVCNRYNYLLEGRTGKGTAVTRHVMASLSHVHDLRRPAVQRPYAGTRVP